jgi:hypothetical protein
MYVFLVVLVFLEFLVDVVRVLVVGGSTGGRVLVIMVSSGVLVVLVRDSDVGYGGWGSREQWRTGCRSWKGCRGRILGWP